MKRYISHESALAYWNFPLAHQYFANDIAQAGDKCYTVFDPKDRFMIGRKRSYVCSVSLPANSLVYHDNNTVVSPYLMFLQLAHKYDIHKVILLADLLFARPRGPKSDISIFRETLTNYVQEAKGHSGRRKALRALSYAKESACSIMEIFVDMFIGLPISLGGLGIKGGVFNYEIKLDDRNSKALGQDRCYVDYCFPQKKIAYEYQGDYHNRTIDQDSSRTTALKNMGYSVTYISKSQLYNPNKRLELFNSIVRQHQTRVRVRTTTYESNLRRIHDLLPRVANAKPQSLKNSF